MLTRSIIESTIEVSYKYETAQRVIDAHELDLHYKSDTWTKTWVSLELTELLRDKRGIEPQGAPKGLLERFREEFF